jgi:CRISPR/Cas system CMR subunit Cmr6 (Cas7 group RAMP superfamily)
MFTATTVSEKRQEREQGEARKIAGRQKSNGDRMFVLLRASFADSDFIVARDEQYVGIFNPDFREEDFEPETRKNPRPVYYLRILQGRRTVAWAWVNSVEGAITTSCRIQGRSFLEDQVEEAVSTLASYVGVGNV